MIKVEADRQMLSQEKINLVNSKSLDDSQKTRLKDLLSIPNDNELKGGHIKILHHYQGY